MAGLVTDHILYSTLLYSTLLYSTLLTLNQALGCVLFEVECRGVYM